MIDKHAVILPESLYERLEAEAKRQQVELDALAAEAIEDYLDFEETPDEEIAAGFLQGWHEAMTGQTRSAEEALAEIRQKLEHDPKG